VQQRNDAADRETKSFSQAVQAAIRSAWRSITPQGKSIDTRGNRIMIRVGVGGCGRVAQQRHLPTGAALPDAKLEAICDVDEGTRQRLSGQYDIKSSYADFRDLVADESADAVMIATPTQYHVDAGGALGHIKPYEG
jgi:hypothetical protein